MKRLLVTILMFVPIAVVVYLLLLPLVETTFPLNLRKNLPFRNKYQRIRLNELDTVRNPEILFVGSSRVYAGIDPRIFQEHGLNIFALGTSHQTPIVTEMLLDEYLNKVDPKRIVFELAPGSFKPDYQFEVAAIIAGDTVNMKSWIEAFEVNTLVTYNTLIMALMRQLFYDDKESKKTSSDIQYIKGGYLENKIRHYSGDTMPELTESISLDQIEAMDRILDQLEKNNIEYSFIQIPVTHVLYESVTNRATFDSLISTFGTYHNFNKTVPLVDTIHFEDASHLNQLGVNEFNPLLIKYLKDSIL